MLLADVLGMLPTSLGHPRRCGRFLKGDALVWTRAHHGNLSQRKRSLLVVSRTLVRNFNFMKERISFGLRFLGRRQRYRTKAKRTARDVGVKYLGGY